jgi:hypothetical protein
MYVVQYIGIGFLVASRTDPYCLLHYTLEVYDWVGKEGFVNAKTFFRVDYLLVSPTPPVNSTRSWL